MCISNEIRTRATAVKVRQAIHYLMETGAPAVRTWPRRRGSRCLKTRTAVPLRTLRAIATVPAIPARFELATSCLTSNCATGLRHGTKKSAGVAYYDRISHTAQESRDAGHCRAVGYPGPVRVRQAPPCFRRESNSHTLFVGYWRLGPARLPSSTTKACQSRWPVWRFGWPRRALGRPGVPGVLLSCPDSNWDHQVTSPRLELGFSP